MILICQINKTELEASLLSKGASLLFHWAEHNTEQKHPVHNVGLAALAPSPPITSWREPLNCLHSASEGGAGRLVKRYLGTSWRKQSQTPMGH